jgi:hypothetical protein
MVERIIENPYKCCCQSAMVRDAEIWSNDRRYHAFEEGLQKVTEWLDGNCKEHYKRPQRRRDCRDCWEQLLEVTSVKRVK